ncbi:MAG: sigma-54 dependent transcriptional regulator [Myxococcales bacterium]|nr:sigma-54 dependent transcriptional regulator [Myxococcales bacterium]
MLLRAALSLDNNALASRLHRLFRQLSVWSEPVPTLALSSVAQAYDLILTGPHFTQRQITDVLASVQASEEKPAVIRLYDQADPCAQAILLGQGLADSVFIHLSDERLLAALQTIAERRRIEIETRLGPAPDDPRLRDFRSLSPTMETFRAMAQTVARTNTTVLIQGETGVGKEWLARALHLESSRRDGPFIPINCGALTETLLESELFGHTRGAFTGAETPRRGHFELAHTGTLFLDEIGEMPLHLQVRLLRVLEDRKVQRLGGEQSVRVDVRIVAATHRSLTNDAAEGRFRPDLLYRLRVVQLHIPPLRERVEDIPSLARYHALAAAKRIGLPPVELSAEALDSLKAYTWPGNVRELANVVERAVILGRGAVIDLTDLPEEVQCSTLASPQPPQELPFSTPDSSFWDRPWREVRQTILQEGERMYLDRLLRKTQGKVGEAARIAGLSERGLFDKMRRHGLTKEYFKPPRGGRN